MPIGVVNVRYLVLGLLARRPMSGYDIRRLLRSLGWLIGIPSSGSVYPALKALESQGLVTKEVTVRHDRPPRKVYSIGVAGKQALRQWASAPASASTLRAFVIRLMLASSMSPEAIVRYLQDRQSLVASHAETLQELVRRLDKMDDLGELLALDYGVAVARAELAWLDDTLVRLRETLPPEEVMGDVSAAPAAGDV
ncbi:MAG TPA: PadR family transcriptional regulator [Anaerolineae bacterium]|nr:PadR family transcriptional regulator [Anaerolineae bacterium]